MKNQTEKFKLNLQLFAEDQAQEKSTPKPEDNYLEVIKNLKENTVPKADYEKAMEDNRKLLDAVINGESVSNSKTEEESERPSITKLREDLYGGKSEMTNLEYWEKTLALRKEVMAKGKADPFVPFGKDANPVQADFDLANKVAETMEECIALASGDPERFNQEVDKRIIGGLPKKK